MSKIASMMGEKVCPLARRKRVYWRPVTAATVVRVGQPVCYNSDETKDYKERSNHPVTDTAYAAGNQEYNARIFCVEEPLSANLHHFAGIVASLGSKAGADGDLIEIYEPNGAIVPVYTDIECTENQTLLGIRDGEADASYPAYQTIIGIAEETKDRSGAGNAGLVWARIGRNFMVEQGDYSYPLIVTDECGGDCILNHRYFQSVQTAGSFCLDKTRVELTGASNFEGGMIQIRGELNAAASGTCQTMSIGLTIKASGELADTGYEYVNCPLHLGVGTSGTPDLSNTTGSILAGLAISYHPNESGGAPTYAYALHFHSGTAVWDGLMNVMNNGDIGDAVAAQTAAFGATDRAIPVRIGGNTFYIMAVVDGGLT